MHLEIPRESARDRFLIVRALPAFSALEDDALNVLAEYSRPRFFHAGDVLFEEGARYKSTYLVYEGRVVMSANGQIVNTIEAPGGVGFLAVLSNTPMPKAVADAPTACLELPVDILLETMETNFAYMRNSLLLSANAILGLRSSLPAHPEEQRPVPIGTWRDRPQTLVEKMLEIRTSSIFAQANVDAIIDLARISKETHYEPGDVIWSAGDLSKFSIRIAYGIVRCESPDGTGVDVGSDFVIGALDNFGDRPRAYGARAETKIIGTRIDSDDMLGLLETHPSVGMALVETLASGLLRELSKAT